MPIQSRSKYISFSAFTAVTAALVFAVVTACTNQQAKAKPNIVTKDGTKPGIVAKIGDEEITEEQLIGDDKVDFIDLKKREYQMKMDRLNALLVDRLIGAEAKKANMPTEEYIEKKIVKGSTKPTAKEFKDFVAEKKIPDNQINDQIKERINSYLETQKRQNLVQAHVAKLTKSNPVEVYFRKPKMSVAVDAGNGPTLGKSNAPITIVEFSDFQCPFCSRAAETVNEVKKKYGNKVRVVFRHFPLPMHREAIPAAEASMCVNEQSGDKFWKFHDVLFKNQEKLDTASLESYAKQAGADIGKYKACLESKKYADIVKQDMAYGEKVGVRSTPTFFINGEIVNGAQPIEVFSETIDEQLEENKS